MSGQQPKITIRRVTIDAMREGTIKRADMSAFTAGDFPDREVFQQFALSSWAPANAQGILIGIGNMFFLISSDDPTTRPQLVDEGDVALGPSAQNCVFISQVNGKITITAQTEVEISAPAVKLGNGTLKRLIHEEILTYLHGHKHNIVGVQAGAATILSSTPTTQATLNDVATEKTTGS